MASFVLNGKDCVEVPERGGRVSADDATGGPDGAPGCDGSEDGTPGHPAAHIAVSITCNVQKSSPNSFKYLTCGIDSLDLGLYVSWDNNFAETVINLQDKKDSAQGTNGVLDSTSTGREFLHLHSGKAPNYRFHLKFAEYELYLAITEFCIKTPNVYLSIHAESIWNQGIAKTIELITLDLLSFGGTILIVRPSRVDLCADFKISPGITLPFLQQHKVTRSSEVRSVIKAEVLETCYFGSPKSPVQLRIYDKGKEVLSKGNKLWFAQHWGIDDFEGIWRVEFQLRRTILRQMDVNSLEDLFRKIGGIWRYLTEEWFSLRLPDNEQQNRRKILPWWQEVQHCAERFGFVLEVQREYSNDLLASPDWYIKHVAGCLPAIAAHFKTDDIVKAFAQLEQRVFDLWQNKNFKEECHKKAIALGHRIPSKGGNDDHE